MKSALAAALILATTALSGTAFAQASRDVSAVQAGSYNVDPDHTQVNWAVNHLGFSIYHGRFDKVSGTLTVDPKTAANDKLDVTIDTGSINTPSPTLTGELIGDKWFNAKQFPAITFKSTKVAAAGRDHAKVTGDLTLHGVTKPVTLDVAFLGAGPNPFFKVYTLGFQATGTIKRSDFGVTTYAPAIGDETTLTLSGAFLKP